MEMYWHQRGFALNTYTLAIEREDGSTQNVEINEFQNLLDAFSNQGKTTRAGGVRINQEKYLVVNFDEDRAVMYLRKKDGGACVARSNTTFVIGTFRDSEKLRSFHGVEEPQSFSMLTLGCESLQTFLTQNNL